MNTHFKPEDLVKILEHNKAHHIEHHKQAVENYWWQIDRRLADLTTAAKNRDMRFLFVINASPPVNLVPSYYKFIKMFTLCTDKTVELTPQDYEAIVMDNWLGQPHTHA